MVVFGGVVLDLGGTIIVLSIEMSFSFGDCILSRQAGVGRRNRDCSDKISANSSVRKTCKDLARRSCGRRQRFCHSS